MSLPSGNTLTCPLEVSDYQFVAQLTGVTAAFVPLLRSLHSDRRNRRLLSLDNLEGGENSSIT